MTDWTHGTQSGSGWALPDITDTVSESEGKVDWFEIKCFPQITRLKLGNVRYILSLKQSTQTNRSRRHLKKRGVLGRYFGTGCNGAAL